MRNACKKVAGFVYGHIEYVIDGLSLIGNFQSFFIEALSAADLALNVYVGKEVHFDYVFTRALAGFAATPLYVEGETALEVAAGF